MKEYNISTMNIIGSALIGIVVGVITQFIILSAFGEYVANHKVFFYGYSMLMCQMTYFGLVFMQLKKITPHEN